MGAPRHPEQIRTEVLRMGGEGKTYAQIRKKFSIPKSTLSVWFKNAGKKKDRRRQLEHLRRARIAAGLAKQRIRNEWVSKAAESGHSLAKELDMNDPTVSKALLAMLYWAEGSKYEGVSGLHFVNTDPALLRLYMKLLRSSYQIDEKRFRARIHIHAYHSGKEALAFWSNILNIPSSQFGKIYVKKRSERKKFRKNFQGICFVGYPDSFAREELLALGRALAV